MENQDEYFGWPSYETWLAFTHASDYGASNKLVDIERYEAIVEHARQGSAALRLYWEDMCELQHRKRVEKSWPESTTFVYEPWWEDKTWYVDILNRALNNIHWEYLTERILEAA